MYFSSSKQGYGLGVGNSKRSIYAWRSISSAGCSPLTFEKNTCEGGGNAIMGVMGDEDTEDSSEHVDADEGKDSVGDVGDANNSGSYVMLGDE